MKVKVSEAAGPVLDFLVASALGMSWWNCKTANWDTDLGYTDWVLDRDGKLKKFYFDGSRSRAGHWAAVETFEPSTNWSQGGPIIEQEQIEVSPWDTDEAPNRKPYGFLATSWRARSLREFMYDAEGHHGPTPLVVAMRCFVASKLGDEADVSEELLT